MAFYGLLAMVSMIFSAMLLSQYAYQATALQSYSSSYSAYSSALKLNGFDLAIEATMPSSNSSQFSDWLASAELCARVDSLNMSEEGSVLLVSTLSQPTIHSVINIKS